MLLSWILSFISEEIFPYVNNVSSSFQAWQILANAFGAISQNRQLQLHIELQELKHNDLSISQYLLKAKSLVDELAAAGRPLLPTEFNAIIYRNIDVEYHSIITTLNLRPELVSFNELHSYLLAHEALLNSTHEPPLANLSYRPQVTYPFRSPMSHLLSNPQPKHNCSPSQT